MFRIYLLMMFLLASCTTMTTVNKQNSTDVFQPPSFAKKKEVIEIPEVKEELDRYLSSGQRTMKLAMENRNNYTFVSDIFESEGVPVWLTSVGIVESGFNAKAKSPAGAKGIWQFTKPTAKSYGLKVGAFQDQRVDPKKSTQAAAKHFSDLYEKFNDWNLVLAAYNAGSGKINRVIKESGTNDFWELARLGYLPKQTAEFVPKVLAAAVISSQPKEYGF